VFPISTMTPKFSSWPKFYSYLASCRLYRGQDSGAQSRLSCGYYFGNMPEHFYRTAVTVGNICRLGLFFQTKRLEIRELKGDMTLAVVNSLASQGWSVRVLYDMTRTIIQKPDVVGVYRYVPFDGFYLRHLALNDGIPQAVSKVFKPSTGLMKWKDDTIGVPEAAIVFSTIYVYEEIFADYKDYLMPSLSAHTGQILICSRKTKGVTSLDYMTRCIRANIIKIVMFLKEILIIKMILTNWTFR